MLPQPRKTFLDPHSDAELECLFSLAAALQAREQQGAELATDSPSPQEPTFLGELQTIWRGLRKPTAQR